MTTSTQRLRIDIESLRAALAWWDDPLADRSQPRVRRACREAVETIDSALAELHAIRGRLLVEARVTDDATTERVDALLARRRAERIGDR